MKQFFSKRRMQRERMHKPVDVYLNGKLLKKAKSVTEAAEIAGVSDVTVSRYARIGNTTASGYSFRYSHGIPERPIAESEPAIKPEQDIPVVSIDRDDNMILAEYQSVTHLAKCLNRPVKTILGWLNGQRCTDPDCYYKYRRDCTEQELANKFQLPPHYD